MIKFLNILLLIVVGVGIIPFLPILIPIWWITENRRISNNKEYFSPPDGIYSNENGDKFIYEGGFIIKTYESSSTIRDKKINEILNK